MPPTAPAISTTIDARRRRQLPPSSRVSSQWSGLLTCQRRRKRVIDTSHPTPNPSPTVVTTASHTLFQRASALGVRAAHLLAPILFNSALGVGFAWLSALCYSLGNIFSRSAPGKQSHRSFLIAILLWVHMFFYGTVWLARSVSLFRLHLLSRPQRRAGAVRVLLMMLRRTIVWFVFSGAAVAALGYGCGGLDESWRKYRPEIYVCSFWYYSLLPAVERAARRIYRNETVEGLKEKEQRPNKPPRRSTSRLRSGGRRRRRWLSTLFHGSVVLIAFLIPIVYVHSISFLGVAASTRFAATLTVASLALKIAMQEAAKAYIIRTEIRNARAMALLVALPTVLIDTQVRIVLLRFQSVQLAVSTTTALALGEIVTRVVKAMWLQRQIRQRVTTVSRRTSATSSIVPAPLKPQQEQQEQEELESWRAQLHQYHATEVCADMYAEYLAIGCSSAITVIFGDHPQFLFRSDASTESSGSRVATSLLAQVAIEVLVDFASCMAELASGLSLPGERERAYFLVFFASLAIVNVNTSAILYLAY